MSPFTRILSRPAVRSLRPTVLTVSLGSTEPGSVAKAVIDIKSSTRLLGYLSIAYELYMNDKFVTSGTTIRSGEGKYLARLERGAYRFIAYSPKKDAPIPFTSNTLVVNVRALTLNAVNVHTGQSIPVAVSVDKLAVGNTSIRTVVVEGEHSVVFPLSASMAGVDYEFVEIETAEGVFQKESFTVGVYADSAVTALYRPIIKDATLDLTISPTEVVYGGSWIGLGKLHDAATQIGVPGKQIGLQQNAVIVDTITTDTDGSYSFRRTEYTVGTFEYIAVFKGDAGTNPCTSSAVTVIVTLPPPGAPPVPPPPPPPPPPPSEQPYPWAKTEDLWITDEYGKPVTPKVGRTCMVNARVKNLTASTLDPTVVFQVKDSTGRVISLTYNNISIPPNGSIDTASSWSPGVAGTYTVEIYLWRSFSEPEPYGAMYSEKVTVTT